MFFHPNLQITVLCLSHGVSNFLRSDFFPSLLHVPSAATDMDRDSQGMTLMLQLLNMSLMKNIFDCILIETLCCLLFKCWLLLLITWQHSKLSDYLKITGLANNSISLKDVSYCNDLKRDGFCKWISALNFPTYFASASLKNWPTPRIQLWETTSVKIMSFCSFNEKRSTEAEKHWAVPAGIDRTRESR